MNTDTINFSYRLIDWYGSHKRELPWRNTSDPYIIWLSEIILQQTRVQQGLPYFNRFIDSYPTVNDLAKAPEQEVLRLWQGLGYYSRARNLHACAKIVVEEFGGRFPSNYKELLRLKGVGKYTAAAIASFAFREKVPVIDGNVYRVLSRIFGIKEDILGAKAYSTFYKVASELISDDRPDTFNQAIMEFGALHCTPNSPACDSCPFNSMCYAFAHKQQNALPVKQKKVKVKKRYFHYMVVSHNGNIFMKERGPKDIWQGLYDFYLIEKDRFLDTNDLLNDPLINIMLKGGATLEEESKEYKHVLTHQRIFAKFYHLNSRHVNDLKDALRELRMGFFSIEEIKNLPKPILIDNYLNEHFF
ncbi:A/G-specific adenine glycosylase [Fulvivirgaceae bacterium BMA10]|uniref:Adenine DNA glycosylase n=1 Tax=Splendidivirga corallicola TaxID=3051826 RepID=A0ABT8KW94_9BACT|nr:A/G-specific adenine glycosylase [Fulvivirgaceae bacterium BMA10]